MKKSVKVIITVLVIGFFVGLVIWAIATNIELEAATRAAQAAIAEKKAPANIVMENANSSAKAQDGDKIMADVSILFRETTGSCSAHAVLQVTYDDFEGNQWAALGEEVEFDISAGGTYSYNGTFSNFASFTEVHSSSFDDKYFNNANLIFVFEDEGGRTQRLVYTVYFTSESSD